MVTEGGFSSPFRAFLAFGDGFGDDFEDFVTISSPAWKKARLMCRGRGKSLINGVNPAKTARPPHSTINKAPG